MANYHQLQGEVDDYSKQMGQYLDLYDQYRSDVAAIKGGDKTYAMADPNKPGTYYNMSPAKDGGLQGGKPMVGTLSRDGSQVLVDKPGQRAVLPGMEDIAGSTTGYRLLQTPVEPTAPTFTRAEATALQNPPQSFAEREAKAAGVADRLGVRPAKSWDSSTGILAKVMANKL